MFSSLCAQRCSDGAGDGDSWTRGQVWQHGAILLANRIKEEVKDPNGGLARQTSRVFDAMSRLQQMTGAAQ